MRYARAVSAARQAATTLESVVTQTMKLNAAGPEDLTPEDRAMLKLDCVAVIKSAKEAIDTAVAGMGSSILATSDITQHYMRDFNALVDHLTLDADAMHTRVGEILLGRVSGPESTLMFI